MQLKRRNHTRPSASTAVVVALAIAWGCGERKEELPRSEEQLQNVMPPAVVAILENADRFELVSLDPTHMRLPGGDEPAPPNDFHGCDELGRTTLSKADRRKVIDTTTSSMDNWDGMASSCILEPRHAIVATRGSDKAEVLICFKCGDLMTIVADEKQFFHMWDGQEVLDKMLTAAGVQLAPKPLH